MQYNILTLETRRVVLVSVVDVVGRLSELFDVEVVAMVTIQEAGVAVVKTRSIQLGPGSGDWYVIDDVSFHRALEYDGHL